MVENGPENDLGDHTEDAMNAAHTHVGKEGPYKTKEEAVDAQHPVRKKTIAAKAAEDVLNNGGGIG